LEDELVAGKLVETRGLTCWEVVSFKFDARQWKHVEKQLQNAIEAATLKAVSHLKSGRNNIKVISKSQ